MPKKSSPSKQANLALNNAHSDPVFLIQKYSLVLLFVLTPLIFSRLPDEAFLLIKVVVAEILLTLFITTTLYRTIFKGEGRSCLFPASIILILLLGGYTISSLFSRTLTLPDDIATLPKLALGSAYFHFTFYVLAFLLLLAWDRKPEVDVTILKVIVSVAVVTALYGLLQYIGVDPLKKLWVKEAMIKQRGIFSTFGNANMLSGYLVTLLPLTFVWFFGEKEWWKKYLYGFTILIFSVTIVVTGTRGAWVGAGISLVVLFMVISRKQIVTRRTLLSMLGILGILIVIFALMASATNLFGDESEETFFWNRLLSFFDTQNTSGRARLIAWDICLRMIADRPILGTGIGGFKRNFLYYRAEFFKTKDRVDYVALVPALYYTRTHNEYLQTTVEGGLLTSIPLYMLIILYFYGGLRHLTKVPEKQLPLIAGCYCSVLAMAFHAIFSFPYHLAAHGSLLIYLGSIFIPYLSWRSDDRAGQKWQRRDTMVILGVVFLLMTSLVFMKTQGLSRPFAGFFADIQAKAARKVLQVPKSDPGEAIEHCEEGLNIDRTHGPLYFYQAQAHQKIAHSYFAKRDEKNALKHLQKAKESCQQGVLYRTDAAIFVLWAQLELETRNFKEAYTLATFATDLAPAMEMSHLNYYKIAGMAAFQIGKMKEALRQLQFAHGISLYDITTHHLMSAVQQKLGNLQEANKHLYLLWNSRDKLRRYGISDLNIALNLAEIQRQFKDYYTARDILTEITKKYPHDPKIQLLQEKIQREAGLMKELPSR
ncbi:O-antigen ligase family protein [candidate division CSSED10-310 bacterium]|uniref:O-antigen ligase family protein n=1 Tax=candidate division CSSED10-310 bacterium TaxID=2855610 RepID=A0ABV6Z6L3_UNCC1